MVRDGDAFTKADGQAPEPATVGAPALSAVHTVTEEQGIGTAVASAAGDATAVPAPSAAEETRTVPWRELPWLTLLLAAGIVAALAFIAGVLVENHHLQ